MQISAANLIAAQQAAQRALLEKSALAAKQATRVAQAAPAFALPDLQAAAPVKTAVSARTAAPQPAPQQAAPQPGARLGQHINIVV
jgi:hypothetical protein